MIILYFKKNESAIRMTKNTRPKSDAAEIALDVSVIGVELRASAAQ